MEQDVNHRKKVKIPKKIFLIGKERRGEEEKRRVEELLDKYPALAEPNIESL